MLSRAVLLTCALAGTARTAGADFVTSGDDDIKMCISDNTENNWYSNGVSEEDLIEDYAVGKKDVDDSVVDRREVDEVHALDSVFYDCEEGVTVDADEGYMAAEENEDAITINSKSVVHGGRPRRLQLTVPTQLRTKTTVAKGPGFRAPFSIPRTLPSQKRSYAKDSHQLVKRVVWRDQAVAEPLEEVQFIENCLAEKGLGQRLSESLSKMKWKKCLDPQTKEGMFAIGYVLWLFAVVASAGVSAE